MINPSCNIENKEISNEIQYIQKDVIQDNEEIKNEETKIENSPFIFRGTPIFLQKIDQVSIFCYKNEFCY